MGRGVLGLVGPGSSVGGAGVLCVCGLGAGLTAHDWVPSGQTHVHFGPTYP